MKILRGAGGIPTGTATHGASEPIGITVFNRATDYETGDDSIVRVTANEVRKRLGQFYGESPDLHPIQIKAAFSCRQLHACRPDDRLGVSREQDPRCPQTGNVGQVAIKNGFRQTPTIADQPEGKVNFIRNIGFPLHQNQQSYRGESSGIRCRKGACRYHRGFTKFERLLMED